MYRRWIHREAKQILYGKYDYMPHIKIMFLPAQQFLPMINKNHICDTKGNKPRARMMSAMPDRSGLLSAGLRKNRLFREKTDRSPEGKRKAPLLKG